MYCSKYNLKLSGFRRGFTLVEMLVTIAIIIIIITLLIVALAAATNSAATAHTVAVMNAMQQGLVQYENDFGQLPPVLGSDTNQYQDYRNLMPPPANGDFDSLQNWYSITAPAEYLLGYGSASEDGFDGLGFRDPGYDHVWNATSIGIGELNDRQPVTTGAVHGPYMQLEDNSLLGALVGFNNGNPIIALPNDVNYDPAAPKVILDYWEQPIRYYVKHPVSQIHARSNQNLVTMNLGDVFLLRPFSIDANEDASGAADAAGDDGTTLALKAAPFALFSNGPDRTGNQNYRFDDPDLQNPPNVTSYANKDNIVEIGK